MLKNNGKQKPLKKIKCKNCKKTIPIIVEDIYMDENKKLYMCPLCSCEFEIKK